MDYRIDWTEAAIGDLRQVVEFIARDNPEVAEAVGSEIIRSVELLQSFPHLGPA
jgi:plasmid stabilization system protein ParE